MGASLCVKLSGEQQLFIEKALQGENILVHACIGSGKTTAIHGILFVFSAPMVKKPFLIN